MSGLLIAVVLLPAAAGIVLLLGGRRLDGAAPVVSLTVAALTLAAASTAAVTRPTLELEFIGSGGGTLAVDGLSAVLLPTISAVALLVLIFTVAERTHPEARFHGLMLVFVAAVLITVTSTSLVSLLASWEIMGATSYALIGFHWRRVRSIPAGFVAFIVTRAADLGLYVAAGAAIASGIGWQLDDLQRAPSPWLHVIAGGILVAGLGKAAQLPFSFWLSHAMEGPSPVSALLHSAAMVAMGGYLLVRVSPLLHASGWAAPTAAWVGAATAVVLGLVAVAQTDLKQLLAASTAAQMGFVVLAAGVGATAGGTAQLIAHAATKALLFLVAGAWLTATGTKRLEALRGVGRRWRIVGVIFLIGALSLAGIPPLSLWLTKDSVLAVALHASPALYGAGLIGAVLSAAYSAKMIAVIWSGQARSDSRSAAWDTEQRGTRHIGPAAIAPLVVLAAGAAFLGVLALPGLNASFRATLGASAEPGSSPLELVASAILAALTVVIITILVIRRRLPVIPYAAAWFGLQRAAVQGVGRPVDVLARALTRFDDVLDAVVDRSPRLLGILADGSAQVDRLVDAGVGGLTRRTLAVGRLVRRAQSGKIADYYAAAAVVAAASVLLLIVVR